MAGKIEDTFGEKIGMSRRDIRRLLNGRVSVSEFRELDDIDKRAFCHVADRNSLWPRTPLENYGEIDSGEHLRWLKCYMLDYCVRAALPPKFDSMRKALAKKMGPDGYVERVIATRDIVEKAQGVIMAGGEVPPVSEICKIWDLTDKGGTCAYYYGDVYNDAIKSGRRFDQLLENALASGFPAYSSTLIFRNGVRVYNNDEGGITYRNSSQFTTRKFANRQEFWEYAARITARRQSGEDSEEPPSRPMLKGLERVGPDRQAGLATAEKFQERFGFRGGEFGTWLSQEDRRQSLAWACQSLADLAAVLRIGEAEIGGGSLGFAFGARGRGGKNAAAAHYEPFLNVINLTKFNGAGATAHEWGHFLDYQILRPKGLGSNAMEWLRTRRPESQAERMAHVREMMKDAEFGIATWFDAKNSKHIREKFGSFSDIDAYRDYFLDIAKHIEKAKVSKSYVRCVEYRLDSWRLQSKFENGCIELDFYKNARELDSRRSKPYWSTQEELFARAFERYVLSRLEQCGMRNDYLVALYRHRLNPYPDGHEAELTNREIEKLLASVFTLGPEPPVYGAREPAPETAPEAALEAGKAPERESPDDARKRRPRAFQQLRLF